MEAPLPRPRMMALGPLLPLAVRQHEEKQGVEMQMLQEQEACLLHTAATAAAFRYTAVLAAGRKGAVALATCALPSHPFPTKPYAVKLIFNCYDTAPDHNSYRAELRLLQSLPPHLGIARLCCSFEDAVPVEVLALLPEDVTELSGSDVAGQQGSRTCTTFAVYEAHPVTLANLKFRFCGARALDFASFAVYAQQLLEALLFLEAQGVQHRDVNLDNIMVKEDGAVCLIGFGKAVRFVSVALFLCRVCCSLLKAFLSCQFLVLRQYALSFCCPCADWSQPHCCCSPGYAYGWQLCSCGARGVDGFGELAPRRARCECECQCGLQWPGGV